MINYEVRHKLANKLLDQVIDIAFEKGYGDKGAWRRVRRLSNATARYKDIIRGLPIKPHNLTLMCIYHPLTPDEKKTSQWHRMGCDWAEAKWNESTRKKFFERYGDIIANARPVFNE